MNKETNANKTTLPTCKVSVITPVYNVENYLEQCLDSLAAQTLENIEFIIVNDGSTDNSLAIIQKYAANDARFRVLDRKNAGYGSAMNAGLDAARGEYIGIVESDDWVEPNAFEQLYTLACENNKPNVVKANYFAFSESSEKLIENNAPSLCEAPFNKEDTEKIGKCIMSTPAIWSGIYSRSFLINESIQFRETLGAAYQDTAFILKVWFAAKTIRLTENGYLHYRLDTKGSSRNASDKVFYVCDEFREAEEYLAKRAKDYERYAPYLYVRKWGAYIWNAERLDATCCEQFLSRTWREFARALDTCILNRSLFGFNRWAEVQKLIKNPNGFINMQKALRGTIVKNPKVSVILCAFNAEKTLQKCLGSLVSQTLYEIEIICVDDGSTDSTPTILKNYAEKDCRIKVITQENGGAGRARNTGLNNAHGKYLSILDADDFFEPNMLEIAYGRAEKTEADIIVFRSDSFKENPYDRKPLPYTMRRELIPNACIFTADDVEKDLFKLFNGWAWDKLFKRDFIENLHLRFQEQRTTNDMFFVFAATACAKRITTLDKVLAHYRIGNAGLSETREKSWRCFYDALLKLRDFLIEQNLWERFEQDFVNYSINLSLWHLKTLCGQAHDELFAKLKNEWFLELGVTKHDASYFYNLKEYSRYCLLMESESSPFRPLEKKATSQNTRGSKNAAKKGILRRACSIYGERGARSLAKAVKKKLLRKTAKKS